MATKPPVSDQSVKRATGRDWAEWRRLLDAEGAHKMAHRDIARMVADKFDAGNWWSQMVTVGYERLRGLRAANQRRSGAYEVSRTKTIPAPAARVFAAWQSAAKRKRWLANPDIAISTATPPRSIRFTWVDGKTRGHAMFTPKGDKTAVTITHTKLADAKNADKMKKYWTAQLAALAAALSRSSTTTPRTQ